MSNRMGVPATRHEYERARDDFRHEIGAKILYQAMTGYELWHWPHPHDRKLDRTIMVRVHRDGAWDCALLCEQTRLANLKGELYQMAGRNALLKHPR